MNESERSARRDFGLLIREEREAKKMKRGRLAHLVGVHLQVIAKMEHGVKNPERKECVKALNVLKLSSDKKNEAYRLLRRFSPRKSGRVKVHHFRLR